MLKVVVTKKTSETKNISSFELASPDGSQLPTYEAGSHVDVHLNNGVTRQYSLIYQNCDKQYKIAVLRTPDSKGGSEYLHDNVAEGDILEISEPRNLFPLDVNSQKVQLFAGGIGITPIMSMAAVLYDNGVEFELHYSTKSKVDTAFYDFLLNCQYSSNVHFHFDDQPGSECTTIEDALLNFHSGFNLYTCGPAGYMDYIFNTAKSYGWADESLHKEHFSLSPAQASDSDNEFELVLARSERVITVKPSQTPLEALLKNGIEIDSSCEMGICGACIINVKDGIPDHRDQFFTEEEKLINDKFTPCCSRSKTKKLVIDI